MNVPTWQIKSTQSWISISVTSFLRGKKPTHQVVCLTYKLYHTFRKISIASDSSEVISHVRATIYYAWKFSPRVILFPQSNWQTNRKAVRCFRVDSLPSLMIKLVEDWSRALMRLYFLSLKRLISEMMNPPTDNPLHLKNFPACVIILTVKLINKKAGRRCSNVDFLPINRYSGQEAVW